MMYSNNVFSVIDILFDGMLIRLLSNKLLFAAEHSIATTAVKNTKHICMRVH